MTGRHDELDDGSGLIDALVEALRERFGDQAAFVADNQIVAAQGVALDTWREIGRRLAAGSDDAASSNFGAGGIG